MNDEKIQRTIIIGQTRTNRGRLIKTQMVAFGRPSDFDDPRWMEREDTARLRCGNCDGAGAVPRVTRTGRVKGRQTCPACLGARFVFALNYERPKPDEVPE